jgi:oleate hydratase
MWATTFAFQPSHSAVEFKRYLHGFMLEFTRIYTLAGVKRTMYNQYESMLLPLQAWLTSKGVSFVAFAGACPRPSPSAKATWSSCRTPP